MGPAVCVLRLEQITGALRTGDDIAKRDADRENGKR